MKYRQDKYGNDISALGFGCMRFTKTLGKVDIDKATAEVKAAIDAGVNYFDTAYIYPGIEAALGEIFERLDARDKVKIATKLPQYMIKSRDELDKYFDEELSRLRTDRVDYYLMHMLNDPATWERLKGIGIEEWISEKKQSGQIGQIGFSYHGNSDKFIALLDSYDWDFCQIQYNYLDVNSQAGVTGLRAAHAKGIPVIIMEPLRGGKLAVNLPKDAMALFNSYKIKRSPAEWALRWLWDQEEVTCVLSGMNSSETVAENVRAASEASVGELTDEDRALLDSVAKAINKNMKIPCTGCRYCMPCPKGVDIPGIFAAYNRRYADGFYYGMKDYFMCTTLRRDTSCASNCVKCGKCETHCPQGINIRDRLEDAKRLFEGPIYKIGKKVIKLRMKY